MNYEQIYLTHCLIDLLSIITLVAALYNSRFQGELQKHQKFASYILKADLIWSLTELTLENLQYFIHFRFNHQPKFIYILGFIDGFSINFSFSMMVCIAYTLYYESSSIYFSLEQAFNGLIQKSIIVSFTITIMVNITLWNQQRHAYLETNQLLLCFYFFPMMFYYVAAVRSLMSLGLGLKLSQFKQLSIFPLIFILCQFIPFIIAFNFSQGVQIFVLIRESYGFFDALAYGFLMYQNQEQNNDNILTETDELSLDFNDIN